MKYALSALMLVAGSSLLFAVILDPGREWMSIAWSIFAVAWLAFAAFKFAEYRASKRDTLQGIEQ